jgi:hypothetical protein
MVYLSWVICIGATILGMSRSSQAQNETESAKAKEGTENVAAGEDRASAERAEDKLQEVDLADDRLKLQLSSSWKQVKPRSRIIEREFVVPPAEGERVPGRLTMMQSGGGVKANIERWKGQFTPTPNTGSEQEVAVDELEVAGLRVHVVDLSGTFLDQPGPFAPGIKRPGYRMLGAIIETEEVGDYYVKFYGPAATVEAHREAFDQMVQSLRWDDQ